MLTERLGRVVSEVRSATFQNPSDWLLDAFGGTGTIAGPRINSNTALTVPSFFAGVKILAETMGSMPCEVRRWDGDNMQVHVPAVNSRLWGLLHDRPNPEVEAGDFWEIVTAHLCIRGNAYCFGQRDGFGRVIAFWPIPPHLVQVVRDPGTRRKMFLVAADIESAVQMPFYSEDILHFRAFGPDPMRGLSPISAMRETIGRGIAEQDYQSALMHNGARPAGILTTDKKMDPEAGRKLARRFKRAVGGYNRAGETVILEEGLTWQQVSLSAGDLQFIEQRQFTTRDFARFMRLPADMLLVDTGANLHYTSDETVGLRFLTWTMMPFRRRIEGPLRIYDQLPWTAGAPAGRMFPLFKSDLLMSVDRKTRFEAYELALRNGWMAPDEVRIEEGLAPLGGAYAQPRPVIAAPDKTTRELPPGTGAGRELDVDRVLAELTA